MHLGGGGVLIPQSSGLVGAAPRSFAAASVAAESEPLVRAQVNDGEVGQGGKYGSPAFRTDAPASAWARWRAAPAPGPPENEEPAQSGPLGDDQPGMSEVAQADRFAYSGRHHTN
jgi:hypothetical protein